jgi:hypothetical protein
MALLSQFLLLVRAYRWRDDHNFFLKDKRSVSLPEYGGGGEGLIILIAVLIR